MGQSIPRFLVSGLIMLIIVLGTSQRVTGWFEEVGKNPQLNKKRETLVAI